MFPECPQSELGGERMTYNTYHCAKCGCPTTDATALCRECEEIESMKNKIHNGDSVKLMEELMDNTID